jgi:hypothetical protein
MINKYAERYNYFQAYLQNVQTHKINKNITNAKKLWRLG